MKIFNFGLKYIFLLLGLSSFAQSGPGGVGHTDGTSNLVLWTNPDDISEGDNTAFSTWADVSGYSSNLTQTNESLQPIIKTVSEDVNGFPFVRFQTTNRRLVKTNFTNFPTTAISGFYVNKTGDNNDGVLSYASTAHNNNFLIFRSGNLRMYRNNSRTFNLTANTNTWNVVGFGWTSSGGNSRISLNGTNGTTVSANQNGTPITAGGDFSLAGEQDGRSSPYSFDTGQAHQGDFSEVILFNTYINEAKRIIVSNYLSAKYDIDYANGAVATTDFYLQDDNGDFDFNVAGIGQASDGSNHTDSQGTGIIRINTPSSLSNNDFLFWGEDIKDANYDFSSSASTNYLERLDTKWRVSKRNDLGTVSVSINASDLDLTEFSCDNLNLIVSSSSTFATKKAYALTLNLGVYTTDIPVSFTDGDYFTLEYIDTIVVDNLQYYNGSGVSNVPNTSDDCYKLLVKSNATGALTLTEDADVREIEIESGGLLSVDTGQRLQVTNGINNNGDLRLVGNSQLIQTHTSANLNTGSGSLHVDQTATTSSVYHSGYWSSPVRKTGTSIAVPYSINDVLKDGTIPTSATPTAGEAKDINFIDGYDGSKDKSPIEISTRWLATLNNAEDWTDFVSPTNPVLSPGIGWNMKSVGATFTFKGLPNDGEYSYPVEKGMYTLIGNPYPSALDAEAFMKDNDGEFNGELYIYESKDDTHIRKDYTGTYSVIMRDVTIHSGKYLPIGQAFFITKDTEGTGTVSFKNKQRTSTNVTDTGIIIAKTKSKENIKTADLPSLKIGFNFYLSEVVKREREVAVVFRGLTNKYDTNFDAEMWALQPTDMYLTVSDRTNPFIITGIESFNEELEIPLVVKSDIERNVHFSLDEIKNIDTPVYLLDKVTNTYYNLREGKSTLHIDAGEFTDRFFITFKNNVLSLDDDLLNGNFNIYQDASTKKLIIKNINDKIINNISIYTLTGKKIIELSDNKRLKSTEIKFKTNKISTAVYIVNVTTEQGVISKKILIQ